MLDESILTGESRPVQRAAGDAVRSGSFVVEGAGEYVVAAVGTDSYAERLTGEARSFRHPRSPLERALNRLLFVLVAVLVPLGVILGYALWHRHATLSTAVPTAVAAVVTLIPEGLILLASLTYAVASLRMARLGALAQQLNATESLASVDVVCLDKTGTLTQPRLRVVDLIGPDSLAERPGVYAASATITQRDAGSRSRRISRGPCGSRGGTPVLLASPLRGAAHRRSRLHPRRSGAFQPGRVRGRTQPAAQPKAAAFSPSAPPKTSRSRSRLRAALSCSARTSGRKRAKRWPGSRPGGRAQSPLRRPAGDRRLDCPRRRNHRSGPRRLRAS